MGLCHSLEARAFYLAFALSLAQAHTCGDDESPARVAFCKARPVAPPGGTCWADVCQCRLRGRWMWAARESLLLNRPPRWLPKARRLRQGAWSSADAWVKFMLD
jgi:hypothetical protein